MGDFLMALPHPLEESLACPVCLEIFNRPLMLTCGHSFCAQCLDDITKIDTTDDIEKYIECPTCRKISRLDGTGLKCLHRNYALEHTAESYRNRHADAPQEQEMIRPEAEHVHLRSNKCAVHGENLLLYCGTCASPICGGCFEDHKSHDIESIRSAHEKNTKSTLHASTMLQQRKTELLDKQSLMKEHVVAVENRAEYNRETIKKVFTEIQNNFDKEKQILLNEIDQEEGFILDKYRGPLTDLQQEMERIDDVISEIQSMQAETDEIAVLQKSFMLLQIVSNVNNNSTSDIELDNVRRREILTSSIPNATCRLLSTLVAVAARAPVLEEPLLRPIVRGKYCAVIRWKPVAAAVSYNIYLTDMDTGLTKVSDNVRDRQVTLDTLQPDASFSVSVAAVTDAGEGDKSTQLLGRRPVPPTPEMRPPIIEPAVKGVFELSSFWDAVPGANEYKVYIDELETRNSWIRVVDRNVTKIDKLDARFRHEVRVSAVGPYGEGELSEAQVIAPVPVPDVPGNVALKNGKRGQKRLEWDYMLNADSGYTVYISDISFKPVSAEHVKVNSCIIDMKQWIGFYACVCGRNFHGEGYASPWIRIKR